MKIIIYDFYHRNASKGEAAMKTILEEVPDKSEKVFNIYILFSP